MSVADDMPIVVSDHARKRYVERVSPEGGWITKMVADEVRLSMSAGRVSAQPPEGWIGVARHSLYVWSEDGGLIFALLVPEAEDRFVVTTVVNVRVDAPEPPPEPTPIDPEARPHPPRLEHSLMEDLGKLKLDMSLEPLHLPPVFGVHEARVSKAKGKWCVTCMCGNFRVVGNEIRRHFIEQAWGIHRNEL